MTTPSRRPHAQPAPTEHQDAQRTRLIRFRLNPRSSSDQQILTWLQQVAPYYRADAIRTALLTHILRRTIEAPPPPPAPLVDPAPPRHSPTDVSSVAAQKLGKLFSS